MAEPLLYASPHLYSDRSIKLFGQTLSKRPELAQRVRVLLMPSTSVTRRYEHAVPTLRGLRIIPWALPNLRASNGALFASISPGKELRLLRPPSSLVSLRLTCLTCSSVQNGDKQVLDGDFIHSLPRLERLHLCGCIVGKPHVAPPADALPLLRTLHLEQGKGMNRAFQWLSRMQLPAFDSFVLSMYNPTTWEQPHESDAAVDSLPRFLIKHGHKFTSIKIGGERNPLEWKIPLLDLCPNVEMLEISSTCRPGPTSEEHHPWRSMPLQPEMLRCTRPHRHLELLAITASDVFDTSFQSKHPNRGSREWEKLLLDEINLTPFVALEELELPYNVYWPESDTSAKENPWPGMIAILKQRNPMMTITRGGMVWARAVTQQTEE
ncbi:hypothetical protein TRAPUB_9618 [Trametes pubescens]|uniref:Uncharacterized protein n=1 Tax=Trametes pubescens TaxID=154538 RepID=A0A1M2W1X3_TRAPU|nr:hypothetical protein TRAPUB_9618 [Trametes pubescens]